jgi:hypothetical protein
MLVVVGCTNCGREDWGPTNIGIALEVSKSFFYCSHCQRSTDTKEHLIFCSLECLREFVASDKIEGVLEEK